MSSTQDARKPLSGGIVIFRFMLLGMAIGLFLYYIYNSARFFTYTYQPFYVGQLPDNTNWVDIVKCPGAHAQECLVVETDSGLTYYAYYGNFTYVDLSWVEYQATSIPEPAGIDCQLATIRSFDTIGKPIVYCGQIHISYKYHHNSREGWAVTDDHELWYLSQSYPDSNGFFLPGLSGVFIGLCVGVIFIVIRFVIGRSKQL